MLEFTVPCLAPYVNNRPTCNINGDSPSNSTGMREEINEQHRPGDMGFGEGYGVLGEVNLMSVLAPLGLLPHMWTLWELVVSGQDIVVYSPSAAICSACVLALTSMAAPLVCCADMRCYIKFTLIRVRRTLMIELSTTTLILGFKNELFFFKF